jgi:hypothetical protein
MKKLILSVAMLMGASSVLPLVASAESMYQDIMGSIVNASLVKDDGDRIGRLYGALSDVRHLKCQAEWRLASLHGRTEDAGDQMVGALGLGTGMITIFSADKTTQLISSVLAGLSVVLLTAKYLSCYSTKAKLAELNEVIAKLEVAKAELENKIATEQQEQDATPVEQQA